MFFSDTGAVSYTHLDVYKRQGQESARLLPAHPPSEETVGTWDNGVAQRNYRQYSRSLFWP